MSVVVKLIFFNGTKTRETCLDSRRQGETCEDSCRFVWSRFVWTPGDQVRLVWKAGETCLDLRHFIRHSMRRFAAATLFTLILLRHSYDLKIYQTSIRHFASHTTRFSRKILSACLIRVISRP